MIALVLALLLPIAAYSQTESRAFNATNEITGSTVSGGDSPPPQRGFEYDKAGNLIGQRIADALDDEDEFTAQRWKRFTYDPWNRLVRVDVERRMSDLVPGPRKTVAAYTYYAGNQRATKTWRAGRSSESLFASDDDDGSDPDDPPNAPDRRSIYVYDRDWHLLEERTEGHNAGQRGENSPASPYTGSWDWRFAGGFNSAPDESKLRVNRYVWDPTQWDELVQFRSLHAESSGSGQPLTLVEDERRWALTDRNHAVIGLIDDAAVAAAASSVAPERLQRNRYSSHGRAEREWAGDVDGDGRVDVADLSKIVDATDMTFPPSGGGQYIPGGDVDSDGIIGVADILHATTALAIRTDPFDLDDPLHTDLLGAGHVHANKDRVISSYARYHHLRMPRSIGRDT